MAGRGIILSFLILSAVSAVAQQHKVDSLESLIRSVPTDTTKVWLLNELVALSIDHEPTPKVLVRAREARDLASLLNYKKGLAKSMELLGWIHYRKGDFTNSFDFSNEGLRLSEEIGDLKGQAQCLVNLGAIAFEQKYYDQSIANIRKAYRISKQIKDKRLTARCLGNIGFNYVQLGKLDSATHYVEEGLRWSNSIADLYFISFGLRSKGDILYERGEYREAITLYNRVLELARKNGNSFIQSSTIYRLGRTHYALGQLDKALDYLLDNYEFSKKMDYKEEKERTARLLSEIYVDKDDYKKAYYYQSLYVNQHDSIFDQRRTDQLTLLQARFDSEIKQAQIELLTKDTQLKEEEIEQQQVWMYFYIGLLILTILLVLVLLMSNHFNRKAKHELQLKNLEINRQAQQLTHLNATKDKLFSIISHDLRSPVASLKGVMEVISTGRMSQDEFIGVTAKLRKNLDLLNEDLDNLLQWAHSQLRGIHAQQEETPLREVSDEIISLFGDAIRGKKITVSNEIDDGVVVLADRNHLKLILRNLVANSIKFNEQQGMIRLSSRVQHGKVEITVKDSGIGMASSEMSKLFNAEIHFTTLGTASEKGIGIGLLLTKEFVEKNGGSIWVTSELGNGATFTFSLNHVKTPKTMITTQHAELAS